MKKIFIALIFISNIIYAQDTCEAKEDVLENLNSITKCNIESPKKTTDKTTTRQISVKVSASKNRYFKKRIHNKEKATGVSNNLNTNGISNNNSSSEISNSLELKNEKAVIDNIISLTNNLSKEEVKKAIKLSEVSNVPKFEACHKTSKKDDLACFNKQMSKHIEKHFNYPSEAILNKIEGKVWVRFIIDKDGNVSNIKTLGPKGSKLLDNEAKRVISKLPKFTPARNKGNKTSVKYGFPISFSLEN